MMSFRNRTLIAVTAASVAMGGLAVPAMAQQKAPAFDAARLDKVQADYSQYRYRHWRGGNRGAAIAAGVVGLGILGAAAAAANSRAADPYYDGYYAPPPPVYYAPAPAYGYYRQPYDFRDYR
jgi:hypothetical protein